MNIAELNIPLSGLGVAMKELQSHLLTLKDESQVKLFVRGGYGLMLPGTEGPDIDAMPEFRLWIRETLVDNVARPQLFYDGQSPVSTVELFCHFYCPYDPEDLVGIVERRQAFIERVLNSLQDTGKPGELRPSYTYWKFAENQQFRIEHTNAFKNHNIDTPIIPPMYVSMIEFDIKHTLENIR